MTPPIRFASRYPTALRNGVLGLFMSLCVLGLGLTASAQQSHFITFDGPFADLKPGDFNGTYATGINDSGAVTGYTNDANFVSHSFLRSPDGRFTSFQAPGADTNPADAEGTNATAINALGAITGYYGDSKGLVHGFLRRPDGTFMTFEVPGSGGYGSFPIGLNLEGAIVGYYSDSNYVIHAFLRHPDGTFATWVGPGSCDTGPGNVTGCYGSAAFSINVFGMIAGGYEDNSGNFVGHGLIRSPDGKFTVFDDPNAGTGSYQGTGCPGCSPGLNDWGAIAGTYIDANSVQHGFLRSFDGKFTTFDAPGAGNVAGQGTGCGADCPTSLNDLGAITGNYVDTNYVLHGYMRSPNGHIATVDPGGSIYTWSSGINNFGVITGYYADANAVLHGFVRIPD
jgi:hypothetical protein